MAVLSKYMISTNYNFIFIKRYAKHDKYLLGINYAYKIAIRYQKMQRSALSDTIKRISLMIVCILNVLLGQ